MRPPTTRLWFVESLSFSRLAAALLFSALVFQDIHVAIPATLYLFAMCSDLIDGYLARRLNAETYFGKVLDLVSDKSLTIVSLLYAAARGINLIPLAFIGTREIIMLRARLIVVDGTQLFPTNRLLGGVLWLLLWGNTLFLVLGGASSDRVRTANVVYWGCALVFAFNLLVRVYVSVPRIKDSLKTDGS
jgi:phosphatidylglycerophosphate synthase